MTPAAWKLELPVLPPSCVAHFPNKPLAWTVRGTYRTGGMAGASCRCTLYTPAHTTQAQAEALAAAENPWMRVAAVAAAGWTAPQ